MERLINTYYCYSRLDIYDLNYTIVNFVDADSPKINCSVELKAGDPVVIHCDVRSKPQASLFSWIIDSNGTTLRSDDEFVNISVSVSIATSCGLMVAGRLE